MGRFVPALISLDGSEKYVVYDDNGSMKKVSRTLSVNDMNRDPFYVRFDAVYDEVHSEYIVTPNVPFSEVLSACDTNKEIHAVLYIGGSGLVSCFHSTFSMITTTDGSEKATFGFIEPSIFSETVAISVYMIEYDSDGAVLTTGDIE